MDQALSVWNADKTAYEPEIGRTSFLKAKVMYGLGDEQGAMVMLKQAAAMLKSLSPQETKGYKDLTEQDFDALITFWSK